MRPSHKIILLDFGLEFRITPKRSSVQLESLYAMDGKKQNTIHLLFNWHRQDLQMLNHLTFVSLGILLS